MSKVADIALLKILPTSRPLWGTSIDDPGSRLDAMLPNDDLYSLAAER
jgi:hypothetical protein